MTRPPEYENLIKTGAFAAVTPTEGAVAQYLKNAADYLETAKALNPSKPMPMFTMAYEGMYSLVQAVLEFHTVRTKDAGRNLAIQRVASDLKLEPGEFKLMSDAHARRNGTTYVSPFPPVTRAEANALIALLEKCLARTHALTGA
jgi:hypothetical protein